MHLVTLKSTAYLHDPSLVGFMVHADLQTGAWVPWMTMALVYREVVLKNSEFAGIGFGARREMQQQGQRGRDAGDQRDREPTAR